MATQLSIWHGALDATVNINNAQASTAQWADLHGLSLSDAKQEMVDGAIRLHWGDRLEVYTLATLGHGTPIDSSDVGQPAPFVLDAGISSTRRIAAFWGLAPAAAARPAPKPAPDRARAAAQTGTACRLWRRCSARRRRRQNRLHIQRKTENAILRALKAAGLIRRR